MQRRQTNGLACAASGCIAAGFFLFLIAAPAVAQVPDAGDLVEEVTDDIGNAASQAGNGVADAVEDVSGDVGDAVGGEAGQSVKDAGSTAGEIVGDTTSEAGDQIGDTGAGVNDLLDDVIGGAGGLQPQPNPGPDVRNGGRSGRFGDTSTGGVGDATGTSLGTQLGPAGTTTSVFTTEVDGMVTRDPGPGRTILDALAAITFPLALIALVAAFLAIQGKLDRSDPKLSLAILDPEDERLSFR